MTQIKPRIIDAIYRHAISEYPRECCGIIIGKKSERENLEQVFPCRNLQDEMHAKEPERFPRTSQIAYFLSPDDLFKIQKIARNLKMEMKIIYHSHIDVGAYFSEEDKKQATHEGNPLYPGVMYLVVDTTKGVKSRRDLTPLVHGAKLFAWDDSKKDFVEINWEEI